MVCVRATAGTWERTAWRWAVEQRCVYEISFLLKQIKKKLLCPSPRFSQVASCCCWERRRLSGENAHLDTSQLECQLPGLRMLTPKGRKLGSWAHSGSWGGQAKPGPDDLWGLSSASIQKNTLLTDQTVWAPFHDMTGVGFITGRVMAGRWFFFLFRKAGDKIPDGGTIIITENPSSCVCVCSKATPCGGPGLLLAGS